MISQFTAPSCALWCWYSARLLSKKSQPICK